MKKRFLAVITTLCMALSLLPVAAFATGSTEIPWYDDSLTELVIDSKEDLLAFAEQVNEKGNTFSGKTVKLGADIDLTSAAWTPIGNGTSNGSIYTGNAFKGIFDGNGKTITGLGISSGNCVGLFGIIDGATVKNLTFIGANISGSERAAVAVGLMVGNSTVSSITVDENSTVSGKKYVAGIVGAMTIEGTISDCTNNAKIEGTTYNVGGIVGAAYYTAAGKTMTVSDCTNNGTVTGPYAVGGIVGLSTADVEGCSNTAAITATNMDIGGIVGEQKVAGSVIGCTNSGAVTNTGSGYGTGGIIGWVRYPGYPSTDYGYGEVIEVSGNKNSGVIDGGNDAGGIIGTVYNTASVTGNENSAETIKATEFAAGVVANVQFTETVGGGLPQQKVDLQNNISTTVIDNISANCKHLYAYDNSTGSQDGEISDNSGAWVAQVGEEKYATLQAAIDDAQSGDEIDILAEIPLTGPVVVNSDDSIILDLNGYTVSYDSAVQGEAMITNKGTLTINDSSADKTGEIYYDITDVTADSSYGKGNYTIDNAGTLTVNGGKINIAKLSRHAKYPINNNSTTGDAVLVINGGHLYNYNTSAIRQFCNSTTYQNSVTINGGLIEGYSAIWMQNPGATTVNGTLTITDGEIKTTANAYVEGTATVAEVSSKIYFTTEGGAWSNDSAVTITGGIFNENVDFAGEDPAVSVSDGIFNGNVVSSHQTNFITGGKFSVKPAENCIVGGAQAAKNGDGTWGIVPADDSVATIGNVGYTTLQDAIDAAKDGDTVTLLKNSSGAGAVIDKSITIDFGGYTYSFISGVGSGDLTSNGFQILQESGSVTLKNGTLEVADSAKSSMYILVQNYADLTVTDMTLDGTNLDKWSTHEDQETNGDSYTLSINSGTVTINGKTDIIANDDGSKAYAFDVCDNSGYTGAPSVTVNTTGTITGKIDVSNIGDSTFAISGGTFTVPVERAWCAAGYEPVNLGGGKYGVQVDRPASSGSSSPSYKVEIESMDNGDVSANRTSAKKGSTVTITVTPDAGYELGHLVVLDKNGDSLELTAQENGTYTFKMPASKVTVQAGFALAEDTHDCPSEKFTDVDQSLWYHEGIDYAIQQGLMNGTSSTTFEPGSTTTRGMIVTILHRLEGTPAAAAPSFQDVADGQWYTDAVAWAAANGIVTGYDANTFGPMDPITREQMAAILYRYAAYKGCDVSGLADLYSFTDAGSVSAYAETAMAWAVDAGLITGMTETTLVPQGSATRAQASTILMRYCENVVK